MRDDRHTLTPWHYNAYLVGPAEDHDVIIIENTFVFCLKFGEQRPCPIANYTEYDGVILVRSQCRKTEYGGVTAE